MVNLGVESNGSCRNQSRTYQWNVREPIEYGFSMEALFVRMCDGSITDFGKDVSEFGFDRASKRLWTACQDTENLRIELIRRVDADEDGPTILLELFGYGIQSLDAQWLYPYLLHPYCLTQESAWSAVYQSLQRGVDLCLNYSNDQIVQLQEKATRYYRWYLEKKPMSQS